MRNFFHSVVISIYVAVLLATSNLALGKESLIRISVHNPTKNELQWLAKRVEIVDRRGATYEFIVSADRWEAIQRVFPHAKIEKSEDLSEANYELSAYHTLDSVRQEMRAMVEEYPDLARIEVYGQTAISPLEALIVSSKNSDEGTKKRVLITAATHGDELITVEVILEYMRTYLRAISQSTSDSNIEVVFVPVVSPEGYAARQRYVRGIDPNRNFPLPQSLYHGSDAAIFDRISDQFTPVLDDDDALLIDDAADRLDIIESLMLLAQKYSIVGSLDLHASGGMVMYPWAYTERPLQDTKKREHFDQLVRDMAGNSTYRYGQISRVIYVAVGSSADYFYDYLGAKSIAMEIGRSKAPPLREIPQVIREVIPMIDTFLASFSVDTSSSRPSQRPAPSDELSCPYPYQLDVVKNLCVAGSQTLRPLPQRH
ncbi:MAG: M14 family metallopeptidase [Oligoflexus sp.]